MSRHSLLSEIFVKLAPKVGARVFIEPGWGAAGQITFASGRRRYFRFSSLDLNPLGAAEIAKDKDYAAFFMREMGYPTPIGQAFLSRQWAQAIGSDQTVEAAVKYARGLGWPVIAKPNSGTHGRGVFVAHNTRDLVAALGAIFQMDQVGLVQHVVRGRDFRLVVLDGEVVGAYERIPLNVRGDGSSSIEALLAAKQRTFDAAGRRVRIDTSDLRLKKRLRRVGLNLQSVVAPGETVYLLDNANLAAGGDAVDFSTTLHPEFAKLAVRLTRDMGLRFSGVDLMIDGDITEAPEAYTVLEVNAAPGLDHYARTGAEQARIVERLYLAVLTAMDRGD